MGTVKREKLGRHRGFTDWEREQLGAVFESEYEFLARHRLLLPGDEARRDRLEERKASCPR